MKKTFEGTIQAGVETTLCDYLAQHSGLSKTSVKDAMTKGAVWLRRGKGKLQRVRRATKALMAGDYVAMYYDSAILARRAPLAVCRDDRGAYSVWYKPAGLLTQGSREGDHCALLRQVEHHFHPPRAVYLVHRLDREVDGLVLVAHEPRAAAQLSALFQQGAIEKHYRAQVRGQLPSAQGQIDMPLDGKPALTLYAVAAYDEAARISHVHVDLRTGRLHQIRRHFAAIGHPVMGDPLYGSDNSDPRGLQLTAVALRFMCPVRRVAVEYALPSEEPPPTSVADAKAIA